MRPIELSAAEAMQLEDTLRQVELPDGTRQVYMLTGQEWQDVCLKVGYLLEEGGEVVFLEEECWAIIRLLSVFARVGQEPIGLKIKTKLYHALATSFLDDMPDAKEVIYADKSASESAADSEGFANPGN